MARKLFEPPSISPHLAPMPACRFGVYGDSESTLRRVSMATDTSAITLGALVRTIWDKHIANARFADMPALYALWWWAIRGDMIGGGRFDPAEPAEL